MRNACQVERWRDGDGGVFAISIPPPDLWLLKWCSRRALAWDSPGKNAGVD